MRTAQQSMEQLKQDDPNTAMTLYAIKGMMKTGILPVIRIGSKTLINYDDLLNYLKDGMFMNPDAGTCCGRNSNDKSYG